MRVCDISFVDALTGELYIDPVDVLDYEVAYTEVSCNGNPTFYIVSPNDYKLLEIVAKRMR